eukprot:15353103-Ditylum_brightwellii.AAC.1
MLLAGEESGEQVLWQQGMRELGIQHDDPPHSFLHFHYLMLHCIYPYLLLLRKRRMKCLGGFVAKFGCRCGCGLMVGAKGVLLKVGAGVGMI